MIFLTESEYEMKRLGMLKSRLKWALDSVQFRIDCYDYWRREEKGLKK